MKLTQREYEICELLVTGKNNAQIAKFLNCSNHTIKWHISIILNKLNVENRTHLAYLLGKYHIVDV